MTERSEELDLMSPADRVAALNEALDSAREEAERVGQVEMPSFDDAADQREALNDQRAEIDSAHERLADATAALEYEIKSQMDAMKSAMDRQLAQVRAEIEPLKAKAAEMMHVAEGLSLYLGNDEDLHLLRDGEPAPAETPIVVYQSALFMDEEIALAAEELGLEDGQLNPGVKGWKLFDEWLLSSDDHVDQICPAERGIVLLRSARRDKRDPTVAAFDGG